MSFNKVGTEKQKLRKGAYQEVYADFLAVKNQSREEVGYTGAHEIFKKRCYLNFPIFHWIV